MTTLASFYNSFQALSVTGVTKNLANPPRNLDSVHLPAKWVDMLGTENEQLRAGSIGGQRKLKCRVVVAINPPGQDMTANRWSDSRTMSDSLDTAIKAMTRPSEGGLSWKVNVTPDLDGSGYWAIVADVEGQDIGG